MLYRYRVADLLLSNTCSYHDQDLDVLLKLGHLRLHASRWNAYHGALELAHVAFRKHTVQARQEFPANTEITKAHNCIQIFRGEWGTPITGLVMYVVGISIYPSTPWRPRLMPFFMMFATFDQLLPIEFHKLNQPRLGFVSFTDERLEGSNRVTEACRTNWLHDGKNNVNQWTDKAVINPNNTLPLTEQSRKSSGSINLDKAKWHPYGIVSSKDPCEAVAKQLPWG
jgi:hypothetical protein